ncbi:MAG: histidine kinase, partial [Lachnospiraceae bacterium]|nr:histidine kinase [Lachnospiraceae bacterium]
ALIRPVRKISEAVHRISDNDFGGGDIYVDNRDELGELVEDFNTMKDTLQVHLETLEENQRLSEQLHREAMQRMEAEQQLDTARLRLLRSQMDPHFLFNTLNVISGMAELEEASITDRMIRSLSSIFRYNLQTTSDLVPLSRELKAVKDYMYLQQMRFGERIRYMENTDSDIDPDSLHIPPLLIQPLVENAVIHGLYDMEEDGRVILSVTMQGPSIMRISVCDNGKGMDEASLEKLREAVRESGRKRGPASPEEERRVGIGLGNLAARLRRLGPSADIIIESGPEEGTEVILLVPQRQ